MLSFFKKLFGINATSPTETAVVSEVPYKVDAPVAPAAPVVATVVKTESVSVAAKPTQKPAARSVQARKPKAKNNGNNKATVKPTATAKSQPAAKPKKPKAPKV